MNVSVSTGASIPPAPILIVDDDAGKRLGLKAVLLPLGYAIVEADSGIAALRRVMAQDFAVILLDVRMPIMDGFETAALIRQRRQSEMTPIIFITAHGKDEIVTTDLYAEGAVDFIFAPVPPHELRAKVSVFANLFTKANELAAGARAVQTSADRLRLLTDAAPIGIFQTDTENRYVYTNPRWSEITGITSEDATGQKWDAIMGSTERARLAAEPGGVADRAEICHRFELSPPGSTSRMVLVTSRSIQDSDGGTVGWVGTLADVTAEAEAEAVLSEARDKATEASRLKSDFLANMSHEIRTPMNGVLGMTELLLETELDAHQRDYAHTVRDSGEALLTIIDDILDFSKVEAGKVDIEDIEFDVRTVVHHVVDLLAGPAQGKGLELLSNVDASVPTVVSGDPGRVRQVLTNLIGNAIKFTTTGEVVVRITESEVINGDAILRFEVSDTGDGIAPEQLATVFQPFVQADTSTSRKYGGTGLGLAISSDLVALMGGDCGVSSRLGDGSEFWFTVRVRPGSGQVASVPAGGDLVGVAALIVDDSAAQRDVLSGYLTRWGMIVDTADSAEAGLVAMRAAAAHGRPVALALIDRSMPGMDGLELRDAILGDPSLSVRPVLMTGLGGDSDLGAVTDPTGCVSLSKPVHREELRTCLRVALGLQAADADECAVTAPEPSPDGRPEAGRLLLAEDNLINQKVAVAMLTSAGYRVDTVLNGEAAVWAAAAQTYDAILMDCQMPELNGYEATAAIRVQEGASRHTPVIAMTAGARREDRERCLAEGMDGYLAKPVSKDALLATVARSVKKGAATIDVASPPVSIPADEVVVDPVVFEELRVLGEATEHDLLSDLLAQFMHDTERLLVQLRDAVTSGDAPAVAEIAHALVGTSAQLGGRRLASSLGRVEREASSGSRALGSDDLRHVELDYQELRDTLARRLSSSEHDRTGYVRA